ncbi:MAG: sigma-54 interaction domain-containing protein [Steroidobacteraceae bacterium]
MTDFAQLELIGRSRLFRHVLTLIEKFAACEYAVLVQGETGTGKELAARAIHYLGARRAYPFIPANCGALPDALVESELFGHVRGAFTDAREARPGIIAQARGGTLFLDEIEAMAPRAQVALLRFLQDGEYRPVGGTAAIKADVRVIGATNVDLNALVRRGAFRSDLLFRLNVLNLSLPALRDRAGDVMVLAEHFLDRFNRESKQPAKSLHAESASALNAHGWPGNIRELENLMLRRYLLESGSIIHIRSVDEAHDRHDVPRPPDPPASGFKTAKARAVAAFEQSYITALLSRSGGNLSLASRLSGKDRSDLCKLLRKHGIDRQQFGSR